MPEETIAELEAHLGRALPLLSDSERMALDHCEPKGWSIMPACCEVCTDHPADVSKMLARLAREELLLSDGIGRGMVYFLPWKREHEDALFDLERTSLTWLKVVQYLKS